jgi:glycosyltransferase involved in cell wall biosynthesis
MAGDSVVDVSIVIPVYGSEDILPVLSRQINDVMAENAISHEIIFVCDASPDGSWTIIESIAVEYNNVKGLLLTLNVGQHNALMAGMHESAGRIIVTMDDDLQHLPSDIPALVSAAKNGADLVYAKFTSRQHPVWKTLGSKFNNLMSSHLLDKPKHIYLSPFRAFKKEIKDEILKYDGPYVYLDALLLSVTRNITCFPVEHHKRYAGKSWYGLRKSVSLWLKMATSYSVMPLRVTSLLGILFSGCGLIFALVLIIQKITIDAMPDGWSSIIVTVLILGGLQLLSLGVVGEYLGRIFLTLNKKPQYVIRKRIGYSIGREAQ